jgi:beta-lactam-binding protein with PASTA domain/predicted Ser/Thr protein kinase
VQTATTDPLVGRILEGRYRIQARIARGGMSTVYSAVDERLDRLVAVKVMSSGLSSDSAFADRFAREARAAAKLAHINTVAVYDQGEDNGNVFLVMELVTGRTLRDLLRERGRLSPAEAVSIMEPVLAALAVSHRAGLVHRDIKPENILLSDDGVVKIADFGLARAVETDTTSTRTGTMMGTVAYCSPEQISRGRTDQRSDVYSAGIVLFELLTGEAPYVGDSAMAVAYQHVHSRVTAPSSRVRGVGEELDDLVVRATDSDPAGRPLDAGAFLAELADVRTDLGLPVVPVPPRPRPNGRSPESAGPQAQTTQRLGRNAQVHDTAVGAPPLYSPPPYAPPPPPAAGVRRRRRRRAALVLVLVMLLLGTGAGFAGWWFAAGRYARVPAVNGEARETALAALHRAGFNQVTINSVNDERVPSGFATGTKPGGHTKVARHAHITLLISLGPRLYTLTDVSGRSEADARQALGDLPVRVTSARRASDTVPAGAVIGTRPPAGTKVRAQQQVTIIVSSGPPILTVPDVTNDNRDDAVGKLQNMGFKVDITEQFSDSVGQNKIISQDPGGNSRLAKGQPVTLVVSKGAQFVDVPPVSGLSRDAARQALEQAGLKVKVKKVFGGRLDVTVGLDINPNDQNASGQVRLGSTVTIEVA